MELCDYYEPKAFAIEAAMGERDVFKPTARGASLVATPARWAGSMAIVAVAAGLLEEVFRSLTHREARLPSVPVGVIAFGLVATLCWSTLRGEEFRLASELRTARSGTPALRAMLAGRRTAGSLFARLLQTTLGTAAVLLADGSRSEALTALGRGSPLMRGGRLERLRYVVEADLDRAAGSRANLEQCVQRLRAVQPIGNREADLYRTHVRVKALLELGDVNGSLELAHELEESRDDEERTYLVWLHVWFDFDAGGSDENDRFRRPISEGELRMAMLLARAQGADKLVNKLEDRLAAIAQQGKGE
jgi:hypothetical protein